MCTAATYLTRDFYFGRTLDYEDSYGEEITVTPRGYPFRFRAGETLERHYAMIGMAHVADGYPLYYDAVNEKGLGMAGLNFVGNAVYHKPDPERENVDTYEFIPWILGRCATVEETRARLDRLNLTDGTFNAMLPAAQLHWIIADKTGAIVVESMKDGLRVYDDPAGVLTNNPPFDEQMFNLNNYMALSPRQPQNHFSSQLDLAHYSRGMGALGLPGDLSSQSRFVRAAFVRLNSRSGPSEEESVSQFFHILNSVDQQRGCCEVEPGVYEYTIYTSCCNADRGIYYYTTYDNHQISAVDLHRTDLDGADLTRYPLVTGEQIRFQN
ncbi:MAG: choloylglycine hydrolase family protein [Clostridiales bacterium]|nr:choloylglycine hydrolase family protein [Clostridiales bacterium]